MGEYKALAEFYPTPPELMAKMVEDFIGYDKIKTILEPSAGTGNIVDFIQLAKDYIKDHWRYMATEKELEERHEDVSYQNICKKILYDNVVPAFNKGKRERQDRWQKDIDCIEIDSNLCAILKDNDYRVLNEDFLKFTDDKHYDLIIMNPPFSNGDEHLLKAIDIASKTGSQIVCLLNAETIRNPYSNKRQELKKRLEKYNATFEYVRDAFKHADRQTDVEVCIVKLEVPKPYNSTSRIWQELEDMKIELNESDLPNELLVADDGMRMAVRLYKRELEAGKRFIEEYLAIKPYLTTTFETEKTPDYERGCLLVLHNAKGKEVDWNDYVYSLRYKYWYQLLHNPAFLGNLTSNLRQEYFDMIKEFANKDFSLRNIYTVKMDILQRTAKGIEDKIVALFEKLSYEHSMEAQGNVHMFSGWKSNSAFKINQKVVIPWTRCYDSTFNKFRYGWWGDFAQLLNDIEKCLDFLSIGESELAYNRDLDTWLSHYEDQQITKKMTFKHFEVDVFKKGTAHIRFRDPELLKRFNLYGCQHKGWLPPSYGKKSYKEMTKEEKQVVDSYEGEQEYNKVYLNPDKYILAPEKMLLLSSGE